MVRSFPGLGRLIPAHAGKTSRRRAWLACLWAHPRSRGENPASRGSRVIGDGSSPLTRGKLGGAVLHGIPRGLIPAHAGKTARSPSVPSSRTAHPRSRGENGKTTLVSPLQVGSSPLTRGKRPDGRHAGSRARLIPAHAGKTRRRSRLLSADRAHPRSRGENFP